MRITCPNCEAQYDVDDEDIAVEGQDVQCSDCLTIWMQTREGEASDARPADELAEGEAIDHSDDEEETRWSYTSQPDDEADEDEEAESSDDDEAPSVWNNISDVAAETQTANPELDDIDDAVEAEIDTAISQADTSEETIIDNVTDIASAALGAAAADVVATDDDFDLDLKAMLGVSDEDDEPDQDVDASTVVHIDEYTPPAQTPPIQDTPEIVTDVSSTSEDDPEEEHPWEASEEEVHGESLSDFVWDQHEDETEEETSDEDENLEEEAGEPEEEDDFGLSILSETLAALDDDEGEVEDLGSDEDETDEQVSDEEENLGGDEEDDLDEIDEDDLSTILNEQIALEEELGDAPVHPGVGVDGVPEELIGRRARVPDVSNIRNTLSARSAPMSEEEIAFAQPVRLFRRGFIFTILIFLMLAVAYVAHPQLGAAFPEAAPYLETFAGYVDILRARAEAVDNVILGWVEMLMDKYIRN